VSLKVNVIFVVVSVDFLSAHLSAWKDFAIIGRILVKYDVGNLC